MTEDPTYSLLNERLSQTTGDLLKVFPSFVALLAIAKEPLGEKEIGSFLNQTLGKDEEEVRKLVGKGISALSDMLKTQDGKDRYTFPDSLRQCILQSESYKNAVSSVSSTLRKSVMDIQEGNIADYLFRQGIAHLVECGKKDDAINLLTDFYYLMRRLQTLTSSEAVLDIGRDWRLVLDEDLNGEQEIWEEFWRTHQHILSRGDDKWPAYKILLQLAVEHADNSPVTKAAENFLSSGFCDYVWLRRTDRPSSTTPSPFLFKFAGKSESIKSAKFLASGALLTWYYHEPTLRLWDITDGHCMAILEGHVGTIKVVLELSDGRILSCASSGWFRTWDAKTGQCLAYVDPGISSFDPEYVIEMKDGRIISWSNKIMAVPCCLLDGQTLECIDAKRITYWALDDFDYPRIYGMLDLGNGSVAMWPYSTSEYRKESEELGDLKLIPSYRSDSRNVLRNGNILSWWGKSLYIKHPSTNKIINELNCHTDPIVDVIKINDEVVLSSSESEICLWDITSGECISDNPVPIKDIKGIVPLSDSQVILWKSDKFLVWNPTTGDEIVTYQADEDSFDDVLKLSEDRFVTWGNRRDMHLWSVELLIKTMDLPKKEREKFEPLSEKEYQEDINLANERVLTIGKENINPTWDMMTSREQDSWFEKRSMGISGNTDHRLNIFDKKSKQKLAHTDLLVTDGCFTRFMLETSTGWLLFRFGYYTDFKSDAQEVFFWNPSDQCNSKIRAHSGEVQGAVEIDNDRIVTYGGTSIKIWSRIEKSPYWSCSHTLDEHTDNIRQVNYLGNELLASRSRDGTDRLWNTSTGECVVNQKKSILPIGWVFESYADIQPKECYETANLYDRCVVRHVTDDGKVQYYQWHTDIELSGTPVLADGTLEVMKSLSLNLLPDNRNLVV